MTQTSDIQKLLEAADFEPHEVSIADLLDIRGLKRGDFPFPLVHPKMEQPAAVRGDG